MRYKSKPAIINTKTVTTQGIALIIAQSVSHFFKEMWNENMKWKKFRTEPKQVDDEEFSWGLYPLQ